MKTFRSLIWLVPAAIFACAADGPSVHATADDDARVLDQITGVWRADDGTELLLCEQAKPAPETPQTGCENEHVIRSGGASHDEDVFLSRSGCGGMCYEVAAYLVGTLRRAGQPELAIGGELVTAHGDSEYAYRFPYRLLVGRRTTNVVTQVDAQMLAPGRLDTATVAIGDQHNAPTPAGPAFSLTKTSGGAGLCPPPDQLPKDYADAGAADAASDAASDAAGGGDAGDAATCTHGAPSVVCSGITCSGATPVCCEKNGVVKCVAGACPSFDDGGATPNGVNEVHCDDGHDCAEGEFCCATDDQALSRALSVCTKTPCTSPLCAADCDCPAGQTCSLGFCH